MTICRIQAGDPEFPVILHIPHASREIPGTVREGLLPSDAELDRELDESTDTATDLIAHGAADYSTSGRGKPWLVTNQVSRLVIDPERFPGDAEPMNAVGRGAVYTRTCAGTLLRPEPAPDRQHLMDTYFHPYAATMSELVDDRLAAAGAAVIIDVHSYPRHPSGFEDPTRPRPALCVGTDDFHTPQWLTEQVLAAFTGLGESAVNGPYAGCYVPLSRYRSDSRVSSVMIELRRDLYLSTDHTPDPVKVDGLSRMLATLVDGCAGRGTAH
ncbi:N-formylglutamate amidohydrolase [Rhodococcus opacus]|uniref:N-formylglutamate amidohydrolase n=1 Tax=Rhodococcus opacus TaxID=37919 RepID=UPI000EA93630|nr:N-formylglutamate amidohydrolase [Rhodococcus opacus]QZS52659.1 N-formylglutamate amidohydrolase [Rhodococcus opacus]RKM64797.1 N-formylglutamate amidohydrolase [Rhodococcus opacus]